jgi:hypothetical protein
MKYKICILCACFPLLTFAQILVEKRSGEEIMKEWEKRDPSVTLYEFGQPVTSCDCNFQNLFRNWTPRFITNVHETQLLSYEYVETITDSIRLNHYVNIKTSDRTFRPSGGGRSHYEYYDYKEAISRKDNYETQQDTICVKLTFASRFFSPWTIDNEVQHAPDSLRERYREFLKPNLMEAAQKIHIGDKIYLIKVQIKEQIYDHYVVCDSQNHQIVWDDLFDFKENASQMRLY